MSISDLMSNNLVLRMGNRGDAVLIVQQALRDLGYPLKGTGYFGPATNAAVRAFQKRARLTVDGDVGAKTAAAIDKASLPGAPKPPAVSDVRFPLWLQAGLTLIGTKEGPGARDNQEIIDWAKDLGGDIGKDYTHDSIPWCALFENHILAMAGLQGTGTLWALDFAGKWPAVELSGPAVGAFAPMVRNGGGHVTCVVGRDQNGNVMGLGGNQSDAVNVEPFARSRLNKGFWWPKSVPAPDRIGFQALPLVTSDGKLSTNES